MPEKAHTALKAQAKKKDLKGKRADKYVYGAMSKMKPMRRAGRKK